MERHGGEGASGVTVVVELVLEDEVLDDHGGGGGAARGEELVEHIGLGDAGLGLVGEELVGDGLEGGVVKGVEGGQEVVQVVPLVDYDKIRNQLL